MNDTYFKELYHILCFIFFDWSIEKENRYNEIYEKYFSENPIRIDRVFLYISYIAEVKNSLYQLNDNNSREAYLSDTFYLLSHSEYFEQNKDLIKGMNDIYKELPIEDLLKNLITAKYKKQPVYNKLLHSLFKEMFLIETSVKELCKNFNIDYDKLAKKYNHNYDFGELMYYNSTGKNVPTQPGTPNPLTPPEQTTFKSLFVAPYCLDKKTNELKNILETNNFTVKGQWRGITRKGNELAYLYHYLKSNPGVIMTGDFKEQIKVFYDEFGLTVKDKLEPGVLTVTKNLTQYSTRTDTYKNFERLFIQWVQ